MLMSMGGNVAGCVKNTGVSWADGWTVGGACSMTLRGEWTSASRHHWTDCDFCSVEGGLSFFSPSSFNWCTATDDTPSELVGTSNTRGS